MSAPSDNANQTAHTTQGGIFQSSHGLSTGALKLYNETLLDASLDDLSQAHTTLEVLKSRVLARHYPGEDYSTCLSRFIARAYGFEDLSAVSAARVTGWEHVAISFAPALSTQTDKADPAYAIAKAAFDSVLAVVRVPVWNEDYATRHNLSRAYMQSWIKFDDGVSWVANWSQPVIPSVETGSR